MKILIDTTSASCLLEEKNIRLSAKADTFGIGGHIDFSLTDEEVPSVRTEILRLIEAEKKKFAPFSRVQKALEKMEQLVNEKLLTHEELVNRRAEEEIQRKTENILNWSSALKEYRVELEKELSRIQQILEREPLIENYEWYKEGYFQPRLEYPQEDC